MSVDPYAPFVLAAPLRNRGGWPARWCRGRSRYRRRHARGQDACRSMTKQARLRPRLARSAGWRYRRLHPNPAPVRSSRQASPEASGCRLARRAVMTASAMPPLSAALEGRGPQDLLRLARLPEGAGRFRAHHHAAARRGLRARRSATTAPTSSSSTPAASSIQRQGGIARRHRRGDGRERPRHRHRLHGRRAGARSASAIRTCSPITGPQQYESVRGGRARGRAADARPVPRSRAAAGHQADAAALRVSEDLRGLQQPLHLLHHPEAARRPRLAAGRRRAARGREAGARPASRSCWSSRRTPAPTASTSSTPRACGSDREVRARFFDLAARARRARRLGAAALRLPLPACRRGHPADGRGQDPALSRHPLPARRAERAASAMQRPAHQREDARAHPPLARDLPRPRHPLDLHRRLPGRDRGGFRDPARLAARRRKLDRVGCFKYEPVARRAGQRPRRRRCRPRSKAAALAPLHGGASRRSAASSLARKVGKRLPVIIDEARARVAKGRSQYDAPEIDGTVHVTSRRPLRVGDIVTVKIERTDAYDLLRQRGNDTVHA